MADQSSSETRTALFRLPMMTIGWWDSAVSSINRYRLLRASVAVIPVMTHLLCVQLATKCTLLSTYVKASVSHNAPQHARLWNGGEAAMEKMSPCLRWLCAVSDVREPLGMLYNFFRQVDIKVRPIEVAWRLFLNVHNCADRLLLKPGKTVVGHEKLSVVRQKPHAMRRNVRHLNCRSAVSKR